MYISFGGIAPRSDSEMPSKGNSTCHDAVVVVPVVCCRCGALYRPKRLDRRCYCDPEFQHDAESYIVIQTGNCFRVIVFLPLAKAAE